MASSAEVYFQRIMAAEAAAPGSGAGALFASFVNSDPPTVEQDWLDFKGLGENETDPKSIWSKALSGFANTEGGVLVWGLDCRKRNEVDCVVGLRLVPKPEQLKSRLIELHHQATDPPVLGVRVESFTYAPNAPEGFVACLVPESNSKPVRSELVKNKPYYLRASTSFVIPSPAILRSLFFPMSRSKLAISVTPVGCDRDEVDANKAVVTYHVSVRNSGNASAHNIRCLLLGNGAIKSEQWPGWLKQRHANGEVVFESDVPLHPGDGRTVVEVRHTVPGFHDEHRGGRFVPPRHADLALRFTLYSLDHEPQYFFVRFDGLEMAQGLEKFARAVPEPTVPLL